MSIEEIAKQMVVKGKGILAADESTGTMEKRLKSVNVECTEKNRLHFRETLFSSSSMKTCISGVILFDETLRQTSSSGISITELIKKNGSIPGIKVDKGAKLLAGSDGEKVTEGLDGLRERMEEYYKLAIDYNDTVNNTALQDSLLVKIGFDDYMELAETAYANNTLPFNFELNLFMREYRDQPKYKAFVEKIRKGK